jgi:hypothetical protein
MGTLPMPFEVLHQPSNTLYRWLRQHLVVCFALLTVSFIAFGCLTVDLVRLIVANAGLISSYGLSALMDGGLQQLLELWVGALCAMALYMVFKLCEQVLLHRLSETNSAEGNLDD